MFLTKGGKQNQDSDLMDFRIGMSRSLEIKNFQKSLLHRLQIS